MILNSVTSAAAFPQEELLININEPSETLDNARLGLRLYNYYYYNEKYATNVNSKVLDVNGSTLKQPTNSASVPSDFPLTWDMDIQNNSSRAHQYLYISFTGGTSGITVHPSQPYPILRKISNEQIGISGGFLPFQAYGFDDPYDVVSFRKNIPLSAVKSGQLSNLTFSIASAPYDSQTRRNFILSTFKNTTHSFTRSIAPNIIGNSVSVNIPLLSSRKVEDEENIFELVVYSDASPAISTNTGTVRYAWLSSEDIADATNIINGKYIDPTSWLITSTGSLGIGTLTPLLFAKNQEVTITYETSANMGGSTYTQASTGTSYFTLSTNTPVYFHNQRISFKNTTGGITTNRDAFTISFYPSAGITSTSNSINGISSVNSEIVFNDNFYQTSFTPTVNSTKAKKRFLERTNDFSLSAYDTATNILYNGMGWMPASATMKFVNDGLGNRYTVGIQVSTFTGAIYNCVDDLTFLLNNKNIIFEIYATEYNDLSAKIRSSIFPTNDPNLPIRWSAFPPENIIFRDVYTNEILDANSPYAANDGEVIVTNLGVDKTRISIYTEEFDLSAHTYWYPSSSVLGSTRLQLEGTISDNKQTNTGTISALLNRGGYLYRVPTNSNIIWNEIAEPIKGDISIQNTNGATVEESTIYSSNTYSVISPTFSTVPADRNPSKITFNVTCNIFDEDYNLNASKLFYMRQYPDRELLTIDASTATNSILYNSDNISNIKVTTTGVWYLSANYPDLNITTPTRIVWKFSNINGSYTLTGSTISAMISSYNTTISVSAPDIAPYYGNFRNYDFIDTLNFYVLSTVSNISYIGTPSKNYYPYKELSLATYTSSYGMTSLKPCNTEVFLFSASEGFDKYVWSVGNISHSSNSNITEIPVTYNDVSANGTVQVSAYNSIFLESDPVTTFNYASSTTSNIYKSPITFIDYASASIVIESSTDLTDISRYSQLPVIFIDLTSPNTDIIAYDLDIVLSSNESIQFKNVTGNRNNIEQILKFGLEDSDFIIAQNSLEVFNVMVSGDISIKYGNLCEQLQSISSNNLTISAYNGPGLDLYTPINYVSASEIVELFNFSGNLFAPLNFKPFSAFIFSNGESSTFVTSTTALTTTYINPGVYSPSLTGIFSDGAVISKTFNNMVHVVNEEGVYNPDILNDFTIFDTPYKITDVLVPANSWQYADVINASFDKLKTNIDYISSKCSIYDATFPFATGGVLGESYGNFKWITTGPSSFSDYLNITCADIIDNVMVCIEEGSLAFYDISESPTLLSKTSTLNNISVIGDVNRIKITSDKIYMLNTSKRLFYVLSYHLSDLDNITLLYYWGGEGSASFKTKFINPVDFDIDSSNNIFILDAGTRLIKSYDSNYQWNNDISLDDVAGDLVSISIENDLYSITTKDYITVLENSRVAYRIPADLTKAVLNPTLPGVIYAINSTGITKLLLNGQVINTIVSDGPIDIVCNNNLLYVIYHNRIEKLTDNIKINTILSNSISSIPSWDDVFVSETEFVTDYVYNDSFKKIYDKTNMLNNSITGRVIINRDEYADYIDYDISSSTVSSIPGIRYLALNEPINYSTINACISSIFYAIDSLKDNTQFYYVYPNNNDSLKWQWKNHYIDQTQRPSLLKNPVSWVELRSSRLNNTALSSISAWYVLRQNEGGNHSQICWNYAYLQGNSYFPLTWEQMEQMSVSGHIFTWDELERNCCDLPDFIFDDCVDVCK